MDLLKNARRHCWTTYFKYATLVLELTQSIYMAPLFVWLEILFAFGYRPELKKAVADEVEADKRARGVKKAQ